MPLCVSLYQSTIKPSPKNNGRCGLSGLMKIRLGFRVRMAPQHSAIMIGVSTAPSQL